jgi:hypothetical protein
MPRTKQTDTFLGLEPEVTKAAPRRESAPTVTVKMAQGLVGTIQLVLANLPWTKDDTLSDVEQQVLVKDVIAFAKVNPPFARVVVWLFTNISQASLPVDVAAVTVKRLARHEVVPEMAGTVANLAIIASAAAHDIELSDDDKAIASLFGGLMGMEESIEGPLPDDTLPSYGGTPDLVIPLAQVKD